MHETVEVTPFVAKFLRDGLNLFVARDIHFQAKAAAEFRGKSGDAVAETFAHVGKSQLGTFAVTSFGDAVGNGTVGKHARNEKALAGKKSHLGFLS